MQNLHQTVLKSESLELLEVKKNNVYIDATLGGGGHTESILKKGGKVIALDVDENAIEQARKKFSKYLTSGLLTILHKNFVGLKSAVLELSHDNLRKIDGVLFDLGFSTNQLKNSNIGLSFSEDNYLDMRMDKSLNVTAIDLIRALSEKDLSDLIRKNGEEKNAKWIAGILKDLVINKNITSAKKIADKIEVLIRGGDKKIHPATKTFMALRIAVNDEYQNLIKALADSYELLKPGGRLVVITFHSIESQIVLNTCSELGFKKLINRPILAGLDEVIRNPSSRSAKIYAFIKQNI